MRLMIAIRHLHEADPPASPAPTPSAEAIRPSWDDVIYVMNFIELNNLRHQSFSLYSPLGLKINYGK